MYNFDSGRVPSRGIFSGRWLEHLTAKVRDWTCSVHKSCMCIQPHTADTHVVARVLFFYND